MSTISTQMIRPSINATQIEPEDLLHMEDQGLLELVDGQIIEKKISYESNKVAGKIARLIGNYCDLKNSGDVIPEQSFQCFPRNPKQVRRPDVVFISKARVPERPPRGHIMFVPDLANEVVSPNDTVDELDEKLADYKSAGVPLVWVISPSLRHVRVQRHGQPILQLEGGDLLTGDTILQGFSVNVSELFPEQLPARSET